MKQPRRAVTGLAAVMALMVCATSQATVHKCTEAGGRVVYSDQPCTDASVRQSTDVRGVVPQPPLKDRKSPDFDPAQYCRDGNRELSDAEMTARMAQFSRSGYKDGQICCKDGKVAACGSLLK